MELRHQARLAVDLGFDGVGLSEHHAGFPGYLPGPLWFGASLLAELPRGFYAALPILLPLRSVAGVVEELAWLDARFPRRVVAGFAAGYFEDDFEAFGVPFADRFSRFRRMFEQVAVELSGEGKIENLRRDQAVVQARGRIGLVMNTSGPGNAQLAGRLGAGITPVQMSVEGYRELLRTYRAAGGPGPVSPPAANRRRRGVRRGRERRPGPHARPASGPPPGSRPRTPPVSGPRPRRAP